MARTPLFRQVRRSLELARLSLRTGRPADELLDERRDARALSRRRLLQASAAAVAGCALAGCTSAKAGTAAGGGAAPAGGRSGRGGTGGRGGEPEVLVIGAGIAGLTTAYRLQQAGVAVRVLEAQTRVGGRMWSLRGRFADGQVAELGGELIDTNHEELRALCAELGLAVDDIGDEPEGIDETVWFLDGRARTEAELVEAFRPVAGRVQAELDRLGEADSIGYRAPGKGEPLDRLSIEEWLSKAGADGWFRSLLAVAYATEFGLEIGDQSALNFLQFVNPNPEEFELFSDSDERFHVHGGNDAITTALAERLGDSIDRGVRLEAMRRRSDGAFVCSVLRDRTPVEFFAPRVVLALPFTLLREVRLDLELPPVKRRAIRELGYGTNAKLMVGFTERVWRTRHHSRGSVLTDLGFQTTWETSRGQAGAAGILTNFTGGRHGLESGGGTPADQARALVASLDRVFPGAAACREGMTEARLHWPTQPFVKGSFACYRVGQITAFGGAEGEPVGRLFFAGEHCARESQGYMNGGCQTGERAAREVLADLGVAGGGAEARGRR
ncbi:MAG: FAD-dependent oxidoreductase [Planctomycetes bacterium]|nr:FAD-dependent oxidoreductase [Planctomycetota bacterium]